MYYIWHIKPLLLQFPDLTNTYIRTDQSLALTALLVVLVIMSTILLMANNHHVIQHPAPRRSLILQTLAFCIPVGLLILYALIKG